MPTPDQPLSLWCRPFSGRRLIALGVVAAAALTLSAGAVLLTSVGSEPPQGTNRGAPPPITSSLPATPSPTPTCDAVAQTRARVTRYLDSASGRVAIGVVDDATGVRMLGGTGRFRTASIVKVNILAALLLRAQAAGTGPTRAQRALADPMITRSDNGAASQLWSQIGGGSGLAAANRRLGLVETTPGRGAYWGTTITTVSDQLRLLHTVTDPNGPLTAANRDYLLSLMGRVIKRQAWGITAAATPVSRTYVKVGRYDFTAASGWTINSIGRITEPGHDWLVAVLSDQHATQSAGIRTVEQVARLAVGGLRSCPGSA